MRCRSYVVLNSIAEESRVFFSEKVLRNSLILGAFYSVLCNNYMINIFRKYGAFYNYMNVPSGKGQKYRCSPLPKKIYLEAFPPLMGVFFSVCMAFSFLLGPCFSFRGRCLLSSSLCEEHFRLVSTYKNFCGSPMD